MRRVVVRSGQERREFDLPEAEVIVGSGRGVDWRISWPGVSRRHAAVGVADGVVRVRDLGSKNGLWHRGERCEAVELRVGDKVRIGTAELALEEIGSSDARMALTFEDEAESARPASSSTGAERVDESTPGPDRALAHLREVAAGRRLAAGEASRRLLGARSLVELRRGDEGEVVVVSLVGSPVASDLLEEIASAKSEPEQLVCVGSQRALWASASHGHGLLLVALFDLAIDTLAGWQESLFAAIAGLIAMPIRFEDPVPEAAPEEDPGLVSPPEMVVGRSPTFVVLLEELKAAVRSGANVLLLGETGTGKELLARTIHRSGLRREGAFVDVNCTAIPESIFESELFGISKGVATDVAERRGRILQANGGTLFLDEVGDIPLPLQPKLLRVIQEREVLALGAERARKIDVTFVAATNRRLAELAGGALRIDLFYRLGGMVIQVPPLRERPEDIPQLVLELTRRYSRALHRRIGGVSARALSLLLRHPWPGNVRELENVLQIAVAECPVGGYVRAALIEKRLAVIQPGTARAAPASPIAPGGLDAAPAATAIVGGGRSTLRQVGAAAERAAIESALAGARGRVRRAAELLGLTERGLRKAMQRLGIQPRG